MHSSITQWFSVELGVHCIALACVADYTDARSAKVARCHHYHQSTKAVAAAVVPAAAVAHHSFARSYACRSQILLVC